MITELKTFERLSSFEKLPLTVYVSPEEASIKSAKEIAELICKRRREKRQAILGLATGSTPRKVYDELVRLHKDEGLSFSNVVTFNLDEYYPITSDSLQSYHTFMEENFFNHIDVNRENCFIPNGETPQESLKLHCEEYEKLIDSFGGIDIQLLGIGRNGHIGFNEPGSHINSTTRLITLDHITRNDASYDFGGLGNVPRKAITMGVSTIMKARRILLLAFGEGKAEIIRKAIEGPVTEFIPATYLQGHSDTELFLDDASAAKLTRNYAPWLIDEVEWSKAMVKKAVIHLALSLNKPILKLTNADYNENGLSDLLALYGQAYDINIEVFNLIQHTITGWPGGKPDADDNNRPERANPSKKKILIFSPHPDDDIISMGGTFQRLVEQGHDVHVAYQTSGNIAVADDEAFRFVEFIKDFNYQFRIESEDADSIYRETMEFLREKRKGQRDTSELLGVKELIRKGEARNTCRYVGVSPEKVHFLRLPFYETGTIKKANPGAEDVAIVAALIEVIQPHQIYAAGDLADPHGTHKICLDIILKALNCIKTQAFFNDCSLWLYKGAWAEWELDQIEMAVPMSPDQVLKKRYGIFKHQSQKDGVLFQGSDNREFWQRAEERNRTTAQLYNQLGLAEYAAMEAFVRWKGFK
jgi:glucosamine-6-phosphate deaminase